MTLQEEYDERLEGFEKGLIKLLPGTKNCGREISEEVGARDVRPTKNIVPSLQAHDVA